MKEGSEIKHFDNWEWEEGMIKQIKRWINRNHISIEKGFQILDQDFDGNIGK